MNISAELSALQQALLVEHLRGPVPVIASETQRQMTRRQLMQHGLLKPFPYGRSQRCARYTALSESGMRLARELAAGPQAA